MGSQRARLSIDYGRSLRGFLKWWITSPKQQQNYVKVTKVKFIFDPIK